MCQGLGFGRSLHGSGLTQLLARSDARNCNNKHHNNFGGLLITSLRYSPTLFGLECRLYSAEMLT